MTSNMHCENPGGCPLREREAVFVSAEAWLHDRYRCLRCGSIPRFRKLIKALDRVVPFWRTLALHEFAPCGGSLDYLRTKCKCCSASHYLPDVHFWSFSPLHDCLSQNMQTLIYADASFDVVVPHNVTEHLMDPVTAWRKIARVMKPGSVHVFTAPWHPDKTCSHRRAAQRNSQTKHRSLYQSKISKATRSDLI